MAAVLLAAVASFDGCPAPFHGEVPIGESSMAHLQRWGKSTLAQVLANPPVPGKSRTADRHINLQTVELDAVAQRGAWANAHIGDLTASPVLYSFTRSSFTAGSRSSSMRIIEPHNSFAH